MFNSESTLRECLSSIPLTSEVVLVDQCSSDGSVSIAAQMRPDAALVRAGANRGFGAGCNLGAANATGEVLIFLNPDASFCRDSVKVLVKSVTKNRALVGPRIVDAGGNEQTKARYWSRARSDLAEICLPAKLAVGSLMRDIPADDEVYRSGGRVPYVQGCCLAIRAESFWRIGGFDERFFLYHEEETLARRLENIGVPTILEPGAEVTHIGGNSTSQVRDFAAGQYYRSTTLLYVTHYSAPAAFVAVIVLWSVLQAMAVLTPVRNVVGLRPEKGASWYRSAAAGAVSGWCGRMVAPPRVR
ncbi:MAG: putative glycosyltransferase [Mycobacterium sp.]|nr:putative glycosyltransferase [Mycobacterium sp.]